ncbi:MAG: hypothetical protein ACREEV_16520, partial [Dongiaceae bacterium]
LRGLPHMEPRLAEAAVSRPFDRDPTSTTRPWTTFTETITKEQRLSLGMASLRVAPEQFLIGCDGMAYRHPQARAERTDRS